MSGLPREPVLPQRVEWPTVALAAAIYGGWMLLTAMQAAVPWWLLLPAGAWLTAWHMSLQHEVLHGHPTASRRLNDLIGFVPLSLWLPYARYREDHLGHHRDGNLTDPVDDPESYYVTQAAFSRRGPLGRALLATCNTLAGRVLLGPARGIAGFLAREARALCRRPAATLRVWLPHLAAGLAITLWLHAACGMSLLRYVACFVYPGYALALVRSFAEHRAAEEHRHRTAIVENAPVLGLLFLHNNLHVVHHLRPALAWYCIPAFYRARRKQLVRMNGGLLYDGYADVVRRFLLRRHHDPAHPSPDAPAIGLERG
ncbi:fatty acid desaturase [Lichenicoccus sp.]|uniref:fatty acid desaturase n=1 Tax=Lichenicoccus sp. TaxID=2781899 RepID=UPI003D152FCE